MTVDPSKAGQTLYHSKNASVPTYAVNHLQYKTTDHNLLTVYVHFFKWSIMQHKLNTTMLLKICHSVLQIFLLNRSRANSLWCVSSQYSTTCSSFFNCSRAEQPTSRVAAYRCLIKDSHVQMRKVPFGIGGLQAKLYLKRVWAK